MLKIRVIPTLLWKGHGLVKGVRFDSGRRVGAALPAVRVYNRRDVDELVLLDVDATLSGTGPDFENVADLGAEAFVPMTVGGGVRDIEMVQRLLRAGADKVAINSQAYEDPELITRIARRFGSQSVVASIDALRGPEKGWSCQSHSGRRHQKRSVREWARELEQRGAGEILLTSIDRDGTMAGYDLGLVECVSSAVAIPVVASGGAGSYEDMVTVVRDAGASAVAAASIFHFTQQTPAGAKAALAAAGLPVRISKTAAKGPLTCA